MHFEKNGEGLLARTMNSLAVGLQLRHRMHPLSKLVSQVQERRSSPNAFHHELLSRLAFLVESLQHFDDVLHGRQQTRLIPQSIYPSNVFARSKAAKVDFSCAVIKSNPGSVSLQVAARSRLGRTLRRSSRRPLQGDSGSRHCRREAGPHSLQKKAARASGRTLLCLWWGMVALSSSAHVCPRTLQGCRGRRPQLWVPCPRKGTG